MSSQWPYELRDAEPRDRAFWGANWANSYRRSNWAGVVPNHLYHDVMRVLQDGLSRRGMRIKIAHIPDDPDALMGFVAWEDDPGRSPIVHMVYVKDVYRKAGLATDMLEQTVGRAFLYTHRTPESDYFRRPAWQVGYDPQPARRKEL